MTNIILIMADQLRADAMGYAGNPLRITPAIDGLAARGTAFLRHHTPNQICSPSRASLFSGLYPRHHGLHRNGVALGESVDLLTHALKRAGFATFGSGKFHFQPMEAPAEYDMPESWAFWRKPACSDWHGPFYGFDSVALVIGESSYSAQGGHYAQWLRQEHPDLTGHYDVERALEGPPPDLDEVWESAMPVEAHYNTWITDRAISFLEGAKAEEPFFLFVSYPDPHHPFTPPRPYSRLVNPDKVPMPAVEEGELERLPPYIRDLGDESADESYLSLVLGHGGPREQGYMMRTAALGEGTMRRLIAYTYGMIRMIDDGVGRIVSAVEERGLLEDTVIIFTSDHGEFLGDHGLLHKGPPPFRQLLEVPLVMAGPGIPHRRIGALTSHIDLKPTLLDIAGATCRDGDGASLLPLLGGERERVRDALFAEYHPRVAREQYNQSVITGDARLTVYPLSPGWGEYFRHGSDPGEHRNLFTDPACRQEVETLAALLACGFPPEPEVPSVPIAVY